jgi:hypothetical protein
VPNAENVAHLEKWLYLTACAICWHLFLTITILDIIHRPVFYLKIQCFGNWILSSSSGGTYLDGPNGAIQKICGFGNEFWL